MFSEVVAFEKVRHNALEDDIDEFAWSVVRALRMQDDATGVAIDFIPDDSIVVNRGLAHLCHLENRQSVDPAKELADLAAGNQYPKLVPFEVNVTDHAIAERGHAGGVLCENDVVANTGVPV